MGASIVPSQKDNPSPQFPRQRAQSQTVPRLCNDRSSGQMEAPGAFANLHITTFGGGPSATHAVFKSTHLSCGVTLSQSVLLHFLCIVRCRKRTPLAQRPGVKRRNDSSRNAFEVRRSVSRSRRPQVSRRRRIPCTNARLSRFRKRPVANNRANRSPAP